MRKFYVNAVMSAVLVCFVVFMALLVNADFVNCDGTGQCQECITYVDGSFQGTPDGSQSNPYKTISDAMDDEDYQCIWVKEGTYNELVIFDTRQNLDYTGLKYIMCISTRSMA